MYGCLSTARRQACLIGKVHVPRTVRPYKGQQAGECGILFGMEPPQKACRTPYSPRMVRYCLYCQTSIHTQARQLRPIAVGSAATTGWPLHTPRSRIHIAEICTLLRLRLLLAAGCWRKGSRLTPYAHSRALVRLLAWCCSCTYESFAQAKQH